MGRHAAANQHGACGCDGLRLYVLCVSCVCRVRGRRAAGETQTGGSHVGFWLTDQPSNPLDLMTFSNGTQQSPVLYGTPKNLVPSGFQVPGSASMRLRFLGSDAHEQMTWSHVGGGFGTWELGRG